MPEQKCLLLLLPSEGACCKNFSKQGVNYL